MYKYDLLSNNKESFEIEKVGIASLYNTDELIPLSDDIQSSKRNFGVSLIFNSNNVDSTRAGVYFTNSVFRTSNMRVVKIGEDNLLKSCAYFVARRLIESNWMNQKKEFIVPNKENVFFEKYVVDSLILTLFHSQNSIFSSVLYKNEFFWMSVDKMKEHADQSGYDELYNDARTSPDRYVHKLLFGEERIYDKLSPDAKLVLDKATELVEKSMELRQVMANEENHLNSWDAGYAQLKLVWKEYFQEDFKEFRQLYKNLEDRMRPLVYELGFLKK